VVAESSPGVFSFLVQLGQQDCMPLVLELELELEPEPIVVTS
jgi:hypothetical protein